MKSDILEEPYGSIISAQDSLGNHYLFQYVISSREMGVRNTLTGTLIVPFCSSVALNSGLGKLYFLFCKIVPQANINFGAYSLSGELLFPAQFGYTELQGLLRAKKDW